MSATLPRSSSEELSVNSFGGGNSSGIFSGVSAARRAASYIMSRLGRCFGIEISGSPPKWGEEGEAREGRGGGGDCTSPLPSSLLLPPPLSPCPSSPRAFSPSPSPRGERRRRGNGDRIGSLLRSEGAPMSGLCHPMPLILLVSPSSPLFHQFHLQCQFAAAGN